MSETETPADAWPTPDGETLVVRRDSDTLVGGTPPPPPPPPVAPAGPPPDRRVGAGMLLAIAAIVLVAAGIALAWWLTHRNSSGHKTTTVVVTNRPQAGPARVAVPRLVGMTQNAALAQLAKAGLTPKIVYQPTKKPKGTVVSQRPQEATLLAKGKPVTLFVDSTPRPQANTASTPTTTASTTTAPAQTSSTPTTTAATAPPQPTSATVPDVTSQSESSAASALGQAGILPSLSFVPGTDELGTVEAQAKPAGTTVPYHSHVQINLSTGPGQKPMGSVPNVVGQGLQQAVSTLNGAHLRLIYLKLPVTSPSQVGKIVQQSPLGGGHAPQNAQVLVFLGVK